MKYIEHIKSGALTLLVLLSVVLTFTIWTFKPTFEMIEPPSTDVAIGENRRVEEVVRPHKALFHYSDTVTGTTERADIDRLLQSVDGWQVQDLTLVEEEASPTTMSAYLQDSNRVVLYYNGGIPFSIYDTVMEITDSAIPESSFDRLIIEWGTIESEKFVLHFINSQTGRIYKAFITSTVLDEFQASTLVEAMDFDTYTINEAIGKLPIYVPTEEKQMTQYTYLLDEVSPNRFVNALFENPNNVSATREAMYEEYTDDSAAIMRVHKTKSISYVQPQAESADPSVPSELLLNTLDFVNGHGGWTNDYRYFGMNPLNQEITYQLFLNNRPVFGSMLSTSIDITWGTDNGEEQIYQYDRPVYVLESTVSTQLVDMPSGLDVVNAMKRLEDRDLTEITDIIAAYELVRKDQLLEFQPAWYYQSNGIWIKLTREEIGGGPFGLE